MSGPLLAIGLILGSLLVLTPQPTTGFTVKLLGGEKSFGEGFVAGALNKKDRVPIPDDDLPASDEVLLEMLSATRPMPIADIDDYLMRFGYLETPANGSVSDHGRKEAIREFQRFSRLGDSGVVDVRTRKQMLTPRCGMADPVSNSKFANFNAEGSRKWLKKDLTYRIIDYSKKISDAIVKEWTAKAFKMWSDVSQLTFTEVVTDDADLKLRFSPKEHSDGSPFDGAGGVLAHAFYPRVGEIHMDEAEKWSVKSGKGINLLFVLVHEIGHALGLGHSKSNNAIMEPYYNGYIPNLALDEDDIAGIQFLYGKPTTPTDVPPKPSPATKAPATNAPATNAPATNAPATDGPSTKAPVTDGPTTKAPVTDGPTTKAPRTEVPFTNAPPTNAPSTNAPPTNGPATTRYPEYPTSTTHEPGPTIEPHQPTHTFPCPFKFWSAMAVGNKTYGFARRNIYEILPDGKILPPIKIRSVFQRAPRFVLAATHNEFTGHTFLFSGRWVYRYTDNKLDEGFPKKLKYFIRAAIVVDNQLIAVSFTHIHYLDEDTMVDYVDGEVSIKDEYPSLPPGVKAIVSYGDGYAYVIYRKMVVKLDVYTGESSEEIC